jgi:hypothetical protein
VLWDRYELGPNLFEPRTYKAVKSTEISAEIGRCTEIGILHPFTAKAKFDVRLGWISVPVNWYSGRLGLLGVVEQVKSVL